VQEYLDLLGLTRANYDLLGWSEKAGILSAYLSSPFHCSTAASAPVLRLPAAQEDNTHSTRACFLWPPPAQQDSTLASAPVLRLPAAQEDNTHSTRASFLPWLPPAQQDSTAQEDNTSTRASFLPWLPPAQQDSTLASAPVSRLPAAQEDNTHSTRASFLPVRTDAETYLFLLESEYFRQHLSGSAADMKSPGYTRLRFKGCPQRTFEFASLSGATKEEKMWLFRLAHYTTGASAGSTWTVNEVFQHILCPTTILRFQQGLQDADSNGCLSPLTFRKAFYVMTTFIHRIWGKHLSLLDETTLHLAQRAVRALADAATLWNTKCQVALNRSEGERIQRAVQPHSDPVRTVHKIYSLVLAEKFNFLAQFGERNWLPSTVSTPDLQRASAFTMLLLALARPTTRQETWSELDVATVGKALLGAGGSDAILYIAASKNQSSTGVLVIFLPHWCTTCVHLYKTRVRRELIARGAWGHGSKLSLFAQNASKWVGDLFHTLTGAKLTITGLRRYVCLILSRIHQGSSWFLERDNLCATAHHAVLKRDKQTLEHFYESQNKLKREQTLSDFVQAIFVTPANCLLTSILQGIEKPVFAPNVSHHFDFALAPRSAGPAQQLDGPPPLRSSPAAAACSLSSPSRATATDNKYTSSFLEPPPLTYSDFDSDEELIPPANLLSPVQAAGKRKRASVPTDNSEAEDAPVRGSQDCLSESPPQRAPKRVCGSGDVVMICLNKQRAKRCLTAINQQAEFQLGQRNCDQCCLGYTPANVSGGSVGNGNFTPARAKFMQQLDSSSSGVSSSSSSSSSSSNSSCSSSSSTSSDSSGI